MELKLVSVSDNLVPVVKYIRQVTGDSMRSSRNSYDLVKAGNMLLLCDGSREYLMEYAKGFYDLGCTVSIEYNLYGPNHLNPHERG